MKAEAGLSPPRQAWAERPRHLIPPGKHEVEATLGKTGDCQNTRGQGEGGSAGGSRAEGTHQSPSASLSLPLSLESGPSGAGSIKYRHYGDNRRARRAGAGDQERWKEFHVLQTMASEQNVVRWRLPEYPTVQHHSAIPKAQHSHPGSKPHAAPSLAVGGSPVPVTTLRRADYISGASVSEAPAKSERQLARELERARAFSRREGTVLSLPEDAPRGQGREGRAGSVSHGAQPKTHERSHVRDAAPGGAPEDKDPSAISTALGGTRAAQADPAALATPSDSLTERRARALTASAARVRLRRARSLQSGALALWRESFARFSRARQMWESLGPRFCKYSDALLAYESQVHRERSAQALARAHIHFRACLRRAAWRGWVAYVEELLRGLEAANMSARYRALDAVMTWQYSLAFNRRLRELPVQETYALGVNGWLRRVPPAKMPAKLLEREALRIQATAMSAWRQVLADEEVIRVVRDKWQHMRLARGFGALRRRRHESRAAWARLKHIATEVLLGPRVRAWAEDVREARAALRRRREDVVLRQCVRNVWALVERRRRVVSFTQRWILNKQGGQGATLDRITAIFATWTEEVRSRAAVRSKRREQHRCLLAYACTTWRHKGSVLWDKWCHEGEQKEDGGAGTAVDECGGGVAFGSTSCIPGPEESVEEPWTSPGVLGGGERVSFLLASGGEEGTSEGVDVAEGGNAKVVGGGAVMEKILMLLEEKNMREYEEESLGHQHQAGMAGVEEEERKREGGEQASEAGIIAGISGGVELEGRSTGEGCESGLAGEEDGCVVGALVMLKGLMAGSQLPLALKQAASEWQELMDERIKMTQLSARDTHRGDEQSAGACEVGPGDSSTCAATPHRVQVAGGDAGEDASPASPSASTGMGAGAGAEAGGSRGSLTSAGIALDEPDAVKDVTDTDTDRVRPSGVSPAQPILRSDVRLEEAHAGPCREGGVAEAPADVQAVFEDVKDEILSCLLPATVFLAHARLPGASSPSDTVQARALPDQGVVCAGETAACEDGDEAEVTTARMDVKGLVRLLKMCDVVPEHVSEEHATNLFVDLTSSLSTSLLASPYSGLMNAPFTGASARDAAAAAVLPLDSCGKAPGPSCSPAAASRAWEEHGQEWGDEGGRSLKFGWGGGESITARGGYLNVKGLGWEHRAYRATIDYGAYCILVERVARLVAHDIKTRSVQGGGGGVRGDAVCGGLDQGQENEAAIKKGERIKTKSKKWWAQRGAVESEPATLYERQLRRQAMSAEEARIAGVRSCVRGWGAREDVVGKGRREASLVRIGLRCAVQEDGEVSGGGRGQGWGGGVAACAGLGVRVAASRSVRSVLPKSVNHPVAHPHSMARGGGGGSGGSGAGCDVLRGPDCIVPKRMQLAYEHPAVSVLHVASGAGVGADGRVSANDGIGPRVLGGPFVQGVAVFRPGKRAGVLASGYGARCVMIADCKGQEEGGVTEGRREEGAGGGYVKLSGWLKRPLPVSGYVHAKEGKKVVLHRQGDRAQEAVGKVTWQDIGEVSEGSGIAGAAGTSKTPRRVHAVHVQRREYEEGSCMARLQARLRVLFESPVQAFVFFEQATTGTDLLRIANITVGLQALGLHDTKLQDLMASLDPTEAGAIGLRGFLAAVAWKPMRWPSLKGLLAELYYWRLNRGFVTAGYPQTIKTHCSLGRSSIEETKRHSRDEETERRLL